MSYYDTTHLDLNLRMLISYDNRSCLKVINLINISYSGMTHSEYCLAHLRQSTMWGIVTLYISCHQQNCVTFNCPVGLLTKCWLSSTTFNCTHHWSVSIWMKIYLKTKNCNLHLHISCDPWKKRIDCIDQDSSQRE